MSRTEPIIQVEKALAFAISVFRPPSLGGIKVGMGPVYFPLEHRGKTFPCVASVVHCSQTNKPCLDMVLGLSAFETDSPATIDADSVRIICGWFGSEIKPLTEPNSSPLLPNGLLFVGENEVVRIRFVLANPTNHYDEQ